jgi:hypothetical protein
MPDAPGPVGFTAVVCRSVGCGASDPGTVAVHLFAALAAVVRASRHGVLVSTGCLLGPSACGARTAAPMLVVQPCDEERRPVGVAVRLGPLRTTADVDALVAWLRAGRLAADGLPAHLVGVHHRMAAAPLN